MRVLVLNNYDLQRVGAEVARGEKPNHHLFGVDALERAGWEVDTVPHNAGPRWLRWLERCLAVRRWPVALGDLGQQWEAWKRMRRADVIYAPCQTQTQSLAYLRALGLMRVPLVAIGHHPPIGGRLRLLRRWSFRCELRGTARYPALSNGVAREVEALSGGGEGYAPVLEWGPDVEYYSRFMAPGPGEGAVAAGRTGRDWLTFGRAATRANSRARILCLAGEVRSEFADFGAHVEVTTVQTEADLPYPQLLPVLARARVLAIPLFGGTALAGLTSLTDALGLGKPVIMTRHPLIDLDIEREKIGRWVEAGDVEGWCNALRWFDEHPDDAAAMGRRARVLAESRWNTQSFANQIMTILEAAAREGG